jgi:prepilin-type N-terminal cleavage/methylation domain-containing protein
MKLSRAFTIVELLIVIVVIAILAVISIIAYNGMQNRARGSAISTGLTQAIKAITTWQVDNPGQAPDCTKFTELTRSTGSNCMGEGVKQGDVTYEYTPSSTTPGEYCITGTVGSVSYYATHIKTPTPGGCPGHAQSGIGTIVNLVTNPSFETGTVGWSVNLGTISANSGGHVGSQKLALTRSASGDTYGQFTGIAGIGGASYTLSFYIWSDTTVTTTSSVSLQEIGASWRSFAFQSGVVATPTPTRIVIKGVAPNDIHDKVRILLRTGSEIGSTVYYDGIMVTRDSVDSGYADGGSSNWAWSGTPHQSTSFGMPL